MCTKAASIFYLLFLAHAFATRDVNRVAIRELLQTEAATSTGLSVVSDKGSSASAGVSASAFSSDGSVTVFASAKSEAITEVEDDFVSVVVEAIDEVQDGGDVEAIARETAEAYANALASAYVDVIVEISSDTESGRACASAFGDAEATATAFARAYVNVFARASNQDGLAEADGSATAIAAATAKAFAAAEADACGTGVFDASVTAMTLAESVVEPYATATVSILASVVGGLTTAEVNVTAASDVNEEALSDGDATGNLVGAVDASASTDGAANTIPLTVICGQEFNDCCENRDRTCRCGFGCAARRDDTLGATDTALGYIIRLPGSLTELQRGESCLCP